MKIKKSFFSSILSIITIFVVIIILLIDKPDYDFFNLIYKGFVPITQTVGQVLSYPIRLVGKITKNIRKARRNIQDSDFIKAKLDDIDKINAENEFLHKENELLKQKLKMVQKIKKQTVIANIIHNNSFSENQNFVINNFFTSLR